MNPRPLLLIPALLLGLPAPAAAAPAADSVVKILATVRYPNPIRPWTRTDRSEVIGTGVIIEGKRILTNAHLVLYATEVYVQPRPGEDKVEATVAAVGPEADLALLAVKEDSFFQKRPALPRARKLPHVQDNVVVYGFPVGGSDMAVTKGVVSRIGFGTGGLLIQISAAVNPGNSGGPAVVDGRMIGVVVSRLDEAENTSFIIPNEEIDLFLEDIKDGRYDGKLTEASGTEFQRLENESLRRSLKLDKSVKGLLIFPPARPDPGYPFREYDVLTRIGDYAIDNEGMVRWQENLRAPFYWLIPRLARGNTVGVTVLRGGKPVKLDMPVSAHDYQLIRDFRGEKLSYFIHGPLVFAVAKGDSISYYGRLHPGLYACQSPLVTRRCDRVRFPGEELVVVTSPMFAHKMTKGYRDPVGQVVREVNGVRIRNLRHLVEVLRDSKDEFLRFRFAEQGSELLVFNRREMDRATEEVMEENGIPPSRRGSEDMLAVWKRKSPPAP
jgi:S1-C subfamily serine protease